MDQDCTEETEDRGPPSLKGTECKKKTQERSEKAMLRREGQACRAKDPKEDVTNVEVIITSENAQ